MVKNPAIVSKKIFFKERRIKKERNKYNKKEDEKEKERGREKEKIGKRADSAAGTAEF